MGAPFGLPGVDIIHRYGTIGDAERVCRGLFEDGARLAFRVEAQSYAYFIGPCDDDWGSTDPRLELSAYRVLKVTPKGFWIEGDRWISDDPDRKQWASRSALTALDQFVNRRRAQIHILERQLRRAKQELALCEPKEATPCPIS